MDHAAEALSDRIRDRLAPIQGITEQKMFGGRCFMLDGNMVCGILKGGGLLARVGKDGYDAALTMPGCQPMTMGAKTMSGFVEVDGDVLDDNTGLAHWVDRCLAFAASLPAK
ncbi:TfoX/Sxy family protein [Pelagibacterium sp.]|uniref:TfoX/Sxy family protein n=1 Tax=Pelagibacterium sp. TaxID=1967288 RepID=UPI003A940291